MCGERERRTQEGVGKKNNKDSNRKNNRRALQKHHCGELRETGDMQFEGELMEHITFDCVFTIAIMALLLVSPYMKGLLHTHTYTYIHTHTHTHTHTHEEALQS